VVAFEQLLNPALKRAYESARGRFVDVTAATGGYDSLDELTRLPSGYQVPEPVARICRISSYCQLRDIHLRTSGYRLIARLIAARL
jgi:hypothetical protein